MSTNNFGYPLFAYFTLKNKNLELRKSYVRVIKISISLSVLLRNETMMMSNNSYIVLESYIKVTMLQE